MRSVKITKYVNDEVSEVFLRFYKDIEPYEIQRHRIRKGGIPLPYPLERSRTFLRSLKTLVV